MKDDREQQLAKDSFSSDLQIFRELGETAGGTGMDAYPRDVIIQFLRSKQWIIEEIAAIEDVKAEQPPPQPVAPSSHII